jgi:hypothetical protein
LDGLGNGRGEVSASLDGGQVTCGEPVGQQRVGQQPCGGHRVGDREVDPDSAGRGHGMGGVPDTQESVLVPTTEPVHPNVENLDVVPRSEVLH